MPRSTIKPNRAMQIVNNVAEEFLDHGQTDFATKAELCQTIQFLRDRQFTELARKDAALDVIATKAIEARLYPQ